VPHGRESESERREQQRAARDWPGYVLRAVLMLLGVLVAASESERRRGEERESKPMTTRMSQQKQRKCNQHTV
jgi:hypothetical protein